MAPPVDSRLGPGTLKIGSPLVDYGAQISNVRLEPSQDSEDGTPTLGDPDPLPEIAESWVLSGEAVQDFGSDVGFLNYCADHALEVVAFEFTPDTAEGTKWSGNVQIVSLAIGGDVSKQNTSAFEFAVQGTPTRSGGIAGSPAAATPEEREARRARARARRQKAATAK